VNTLNDTTISVRIAGGRTAQYDLVIVRKGWGRSKPVTDATDDIELAIKVFRVNNNQLSMGGGTIITIEGQNFDTDESSTLVTIGSIYNWICDIIDVTETQIRCKAPPMNVAFTAG
jgi:IPT/TIG domain